MLKHLAKPQQGKSDEKDRMNTPTGKSALTLPEGYADWLAQLKGQIARMDYLGSSLLPNCRGSIS